MYVNTRPQSGAAIDSHPTKDLPQCYMSPSQLMMEKLTNQRFTLVVASKIPQFGTPKGFQKVFHSTIPTEKCDSGMVEAKKN